MKKFSILVLSFLLILALTSTSFSEPNDWAKAEVDEARAKGLLFDEADQNFQNFITRELFCKLIVHMVERQKGGAIAVAITNPFNDTTNEQIVKAYQLGIVKGVSATQFAPDNLITRQEVAVMMMRAFRVLDSMNSKTYTQNIDITGISFNDEASIAFWALQDVKEAFKLNIIKGVGNNTINPLGNTTVEQSILLVLRLFNVYEVESGGSGGSGGTTPTTAPATTSSSTTTTESTETTETTGSGGQPGTPPADQPPIAKSNNMLINIVDGLTFEIEAADIANDDDEMTFKAIQLQKSVMPLDQAVIKSEILSNGKLALSSNDTNNIGKSAKFNATIIDSTKNSVDIPIEVKVVAPSDDPLVIFEPAILNVKLGQTVIKPVGRYVYLNKKFTVDKIEPSADDSFGQLTVIYDVFTNVPKFKFVGKSSKANQNKSKTFKITLVYGKNLTKTFDLVVKYGNSTYQPGSIFIDPGIKPGFNPGPVKDETLDPDLLNTTEQLVPPGGNIWPKP